MRFTFLRFTTKTLLVVIAVIALFLGWRTRLAFKQRRAVAAVQRAGGYVQYDYHLSDTRTTDITEKRPATPDFLVRWLGVDFFSRVVEVTVMGKDVSNDDITPLQSLPHVRRLTIAGSNVNSDSLKALQGLKRLQVLSLAIPLRDQDIDCLVALPSLSELYLVGPGGEDGFIYGMRKKGQLVYDFEYYDSGVSAAAIDQFSAARPNCLVTY
jgi:hypothetical protein